MFPHIPKQNVGFAFGNKGTGRLKKMTISEEQLCRHALLVGSSGSGKSRLIDHLIRQIAAVRPKRGCLFLDPHGSTFDNLKRYFARNPQYRDRVYLFDINDNEHFFGYNPLEPRPGMSMDDQVAMIIEAMKKISGQEATEMAPRLERWSRNLILLAMSVGLTFPEVFQLIDDDELRNTLADRTRNNILQSEWHGFNELKRQMDRWNLLEAVLNRLTRIVTQHSRMILAQPQTTIPIWEAMKAGKIVLVNLMPKRVSNDFSRIMGAFLTNDVICLAKQRAADGSARPFYFIVDEAGEMTSPDLAHSLEALRKFGVSVVLSIQELEQLKDEHARRLYAAALTNTEVKAIFSVSHRDAEELVGELFARKLRGDQVKHENTHSLFAPREATRRVKQESWAEAEHTAEAHVDTSSYASSDASGLSFGHSMPDVGMHGMQHLSHSDGSSESYGGADAHSTMHGTSKAHGHGHADVPFYEFDRETELSGVDYYSVEEQKAKFISWLVNSKQRCFQLKLRGKNPTLVQTPFVPDERAPASMIKKLEGKTHELCLTQQQVSDLIDQREQYLLDYTNESALRLLKPTDGGTDA